VRLNKRFVASEESKMEGDGKEKGDGLPSPRSHTENPRFA
jgi:hypothetical protein